MKQVLFFLLWISGLCALTRFLKRDSLTILLYHGVAPATEQGIYNYRGKFIEPERFEEQLNYLVKHYRVLALDEAIKKMYSGMLPPYALAITFDDGYENFYTHAYPALRKKKLPATFFITTDFIFKKIPLWVDRLEYASGKRPTEKKELMKQDAELRAQMKEMGEAKKLALLEKIENETGAHFLDFSDDRKVYTPLSLPEMQEMQKENITFGAHTKSHPILSRLTTSQAKAEIEESKNILENTLGPISDYFCYPNGQPGDCNDGIEALTKEAGFSGALTTISGVNTPTTHQYRLRRITITNSDSSVAFACAISGIRAR